MPFGTASQLILLPFCPGIQCTHRPDVDYTKDMHIIVCLPWEKIARVYDFPEFRRRREADLRY